jgi:hypothetical protein
MRPYVLFLSAHKKSPYPKAEAKVEPAVPLLNLRELN